MRSRVARGPARKVMRHRVRRTCLSGATDQRHSIFWMAKVCASAGVAGPATVGTSRSAVILAVRSTG